ncbi:MAG: GIY-YIG nuclease family protein [Candidatus Riflebacteria bacterium]|nr:GIY-YIG nuclease family protein [Candidatus Riflebacteria bacterium]
MQEKQEAPDKVWFVYILRCSDGTLYTGITKNLKARLETHNTGKGAKYTKARLPVKILYSEEVPSKSNALKRELAIKKMSKTQKEKLATSKQKTA